MTLRTAASQLALALVAVAALRSEARAEWYGYRVIGVDAAGWTAIGLGIHFDLDALVGVGIGALVLGPPIVHAARDHGGRAAISLGMRVVAPALGAATGYALVSCQGRCNRAVTTVLGGFVGYLAAAVVDAVVVARDPAAEQPRMFSIGGAF